MTRYLINRSLSISFDFEILEKEWIGNGVSHSQLNVFGCKVFLQTKLGDGYVGIDEFFYKRIKTYELIELPLKKKKKKIEKYTKKCKMQKGKEIVFTARYVIYSNSFVVIKYMFN